MYKPKRTCAIDMTTICEAFKRQTANDNCLSGFYQDGGLKSQVGALIGRCGALSSPLAL